MSVRLPFDKPHDRGLSVDKPSDFRGLLYSLG